VIPPKRRKPAQPLLVDDGAFPAHSPPR
jgi:hypothetical protein